MERHVAVQVQYPRLSYAELFPVNGRQRSQRRLAPIEVDQRTAVVKLFLMRAKDRSGDSMIPERLLHTFRVSYLPAEGEVAAIMTLDAEYDGARTVRFRVSGGGSSPQTADVRVPRPRRWGWLLSLLVLLLLGLSTFALIRTGGPDQRETLRNRDLSSGVSQEELSRESEGTSGDGGAERVGENSSIVGSNTDATSSRTASTTGEDARLAPADSAPPASPPAGSAETGADAKSTDEVVDQSRDELLAETEVRVYFEPNLTRLTDASRRELDALASVLREHPEVPVSIVGHTALYGTEEGRMEISQGRAQRVASYLRGHGWEPETEPSVRWVGSLSPVTRDQDQQQRNRRVEVSIGGDQSSR